MHIRSYAHCDFLSYKLRKISRFAQCYLDSATISKCRSWIPRFSFRDLEKSGHAPKRARSVYIVVPWNPWSAHWLESRISYINKRWSNTLSRLLQEPAELKITWASGGKPFFARCKSTEPSVECFRNELVRLGRR